MQENQKRIALLFARWAASQASRARVEPALVYLTANGNRAVVCSNESYSLSGQAFRIAEGQLHVADGGQEYLAFDLGGADFGGLRSVQLCFGSGSRLRRPFFKTGDLLVSLPNEGSKDGWFSLRGEQVGGGEILAWPSVSERGTERFLCPPLQGVGRFSAGALGLPPKGLRQGEDFIEVHVPALRLGGGASIRREGDWLVINPSEKGQPEELLMSIQDAMASIHEGCHGAKKMLVSAGRGGGVVFQGPLL